MLEHRFLIAAIAGLIAGFEGLVITPDAVMARPHPPVQISQAVQKPLPPESSNAVKKPAPNLKFGLADGTPVKLKFKQTISSKTAQTNELVEFEVVEAVKVGNQVVIAPGATAKGVVTEARRSGMLGRKGKLDISVKEVELVSGERVTLRANKEDGGGVSGGVIAVSAIINPLFLLLKGKNVTYEAGTEVTAFVDGNFELERSKFGAITR